MYLCVFRLSTAHVPTKTMSLMRSIIEKRFHHNAHTLPHSYLTTFRNDKGKRVFNIITTIIIIIVRALKKSDSDRYDKHATYVVVLYTGESRIQEYSFANIQLDSPQANNCLHDHSFLFFIYYCSVVQSVCPTSLWPSHDSTKMVNIRLDTS